MMGMTIERCARSGPKKLTKTYNKRFPNHSTLINYDLVVSDTISRNLNTILFTSILPRSYIQ